MKLDPRRWWGSVFTKGERRSPARSDKELAGTGHETNIGNSQFLVGGTGGLSASVAFAFRRKPLADEPPVPPNREVTAENSSRLTTVALGKLVSPRRGQSGAVPSQGAADDPRLSSRCSRESGKRNPVPPLGATRRRGRAPRRCRARFRADSGCWAARVVGPVEVAGVDVCREGADASRHGRQSGRWVAGGRGDGLPGDRTDVQSGERGADGRRRAVRARAGRCREIFALCPGRQLDLASAAA